MVIGECIVNYCALDYNVRVNDDEIRQLTSIMAMTHINRRILEGEAIVIDIPITEFINLKDYNMVISLEQYLENRSKDIENEG